MRTQASGEAKGIVLDVREDIARGREPFTRIMQAASGLGPGESFVLVNSFEPVPLYRVLGGLGFRHRTERGPDGEWRITFSRHARSDAGPAPAELDLRGLEPPEPLIRILEALPRLAEGQRLVALTDRRPMFLYPKLEAIGYAYETEARDDRSFATRIWRA
jgi:uncharacterized protein (DUF2249 family)